MLQSLHDIDVTSINDVERITNAADLPPAEATGRHELEDSTVYWFDDFVTSSAPLALGDNTPLLGNHGGISGFIYVGGTGAAIRGTDVPFFADRLTFSAPGADAMDISGDLTDEVLVESCNFGDPANVGNFASLGTIDGMRVPTFKGVNFEDFDGGLTFTGTADKVFFSECPFRTVSATGVSILTLGSGHDVEVWDITDCYVKDVQADTEVVTVESGADPSEIFQYRGVTHDNTVTQDNILNGTASIQTVGYRVRDCYPLPDSGVTGELDLTASTTVTGSGAGPAEVDGSFTLVNPERTSVVNGNRIQYDGKKQVQSVVHIVASISGANTDFALSIGKNGSNIPRTASASFNSNANTPAGVTAVATLSLNTGDTVSAFLENTGGSEDLTAETLAITI